MSILRCKYCDFVTISYLSEDGTFICNECSKKYAELKKNITQQIEELQKEDFLMGAEQV